MEYFIICLATLLISVIALFSGFGVGTVLVPVFALFFPLPIAVATTAVVHFFGNLFKMGLVGRFASWRVVMQFGIPAAIGSLIGAYLLGMFAHFHPIVSYRLGKIPCQVTVLGLIVGTIVILSSLFELVPRLARLSVQRAYIPLGGALSGFFGGISGNQGILRAAFLIKSGLNQKQFIGTSAVCSVIVDFVRIIVYGVVAYKGQIGNLKGMQGLVIAATLSAFLGSYLGSKFMDRVAFGLLQKIVGTMLILLGLAIVLGL